MAHYTSGITAKWGTTALGEITELKAVVGGGLPLSRGSTAANSKPWSFDAGTVEVSSLSTAVGAPQQWGTKNVIWIGGTVKESVARLWTLESGWKKGSTASAATITVNYSTKAICQTLDLGAKVNDVWRYKGTFKICLE